MGSLPARTWRIVTLTAVVAAAAVISLLGRPLNEIQRTRRHFADLRAQVAAAEASKADRAADRGRVMRLRAQARAASASQRASFDSEADALERRLGWGDRARVRAALLGSPLVSITRRTSLPEFPEVALERGDGCLACHVSVTSPGFEAYPAPFRTHASLASYVGAASPHPPSRVDCVSCHRGDEHASTFSGAGHARPSRIVPGGPTLDHGWNDPSAAGAMRTIARTEAGCVSCHLGEWYQPGAPTLNEALVTFERAGCYACHAAPGMEHTAKRGPDLRRIKAKLSPEWVRQWLADPRAVKPATWMPAFWPGREALTPEDRAAIDAVTTYLFANSETYGPAVATPPRGDPARGQTIVESVGCLGCHVIGDARRDESSVRRTFGQPLQAIQDKTSHVWLFDWLRDPARYSPNTRMPNLRLTADEAADAAAYLQTLTPASVAAAVDRPAGDQAYRAVIARYDASAAASAASLTGDDLRVAAGRAAIDALGCFNCHEVPGFEERTTTVRIQQRQEWDEAAILALFGGAEDPALSRSAVEGLRPHPGPGYRLVAKERERLALALTAISSTTGDIHALTMPWHLAKVKGRALIQDRNCVGCHPIEGTGGDFVSLVAEPTLGPPLLTPEGARVQPAWLRGFLHQPATIRPWLSARMPTFGLSGDDVEVIGEYLRSIAPENPKPAAAAAGVTSAAGRELFELLKCQQCHVLGTIPKDQPTANLAPDLRMARERLQPDWILAWLRDPGAILPGTRMPTFWPDYPKSFYDPLGRDGAKQVRAIREHLLGLR